MLVTRADTRALDPTAAPLSLVSADATIRDCMSAAFSGNADCLPTALMGTFTSLVAAFRGSIVFTAEGATDCLPIALTGTTGSDGSNTAGGALTGVVEALLVITFAGGPILSALAVVAATGVGADAGAGAKRLLRSFCSGARSSATWAYCPAMSPRPPPAALSPAAFCAADSGAFSPS